MKLHTRWSETHFGVFRRQTEHELFCRIELTEAEHAAFQRSGLGDRLVCEYRSHGLQLDTRMSSLIAGETRFGSQDFAYLEDIERQVVAAAADIEAALRSTGDAGGDPPG
jgi:hypothetical protein